MRVSCRVSLSDCNLRTPLALARCARARCVASTDYHMISISISDIDIDMISISILQSRVARLASRERAAAAHARITHSTIRRLRQCG